MRIRWPVALSSPDCRADRLVTWTGEKCHDQQTYAHLLLYPWRVSGRPDSGGEPYVSYRFEHANASTERASHVSNASGVSGATTSASPVYPSAQHIARGRPYHRRQHMRNGSPIGLHTRSVGRKQQEPAVGRAGEQQADTEEVHRVHPIICG